MNRTIPFLALFLWLAAANIPAIAQQKTDTVYTFRFVPGKDMFFSPWNGNGDELARLLSAIGENRTAIENGQMYLLVTSYGTSGNSEQSAAEVAKVSRNRVKSELIVRGGLKERNFVTDMTFSEPLRTDSGILKNAVTVTMPAPIEKVRERYAL